jgi:succinoglycan biosynthesis transport protein ExoP
MPRNPITVTTVNPLQIAHPTMTLGDIYYVLFRHKWRIFLCAVTGVLAAAAMYRFRPPPFLSEAKLFIRYVVTEGKNMGPSTDGTVSKSPDQRGETIMDSELEILTSLDLAKRVAESVGPEKILAKLGGGKDLTSAAIVVQTGLTADVPPASSVIRLLFRHPDPDVVQPVLAAVIDKYLAMHVEVHRPVGIVGDFLTQETDQLRSDLDRTEAELNKASSVAGVLSIEDAKKGYGDQISQIREQIFSAQAEFAERSAILDAAVKRNPSANPAGKSTADLTAAEIDEYKSAVTRLNLFQTREQEYATQFTPENPRMKEVHTQVVDAQAKKEALEKNHPELLRLGIAPQQNQQGSSATDPATEFDQLTALQAKMKVLTAQLDQVQGEAANLDKMAVTIEDLRRRKELEESNYRYYAASLEQARINEALGTGRVSNISAIQTPSPPMSDWSKYSKILAGIVLSGFFGGIAWAFLIELYFDRSVRRPIDVERILKLPLFLSIPKMAKGLPGPAKGKESTALAPWDRSHELYPYHETLRDRLIGYFESRNLIHKPKLVAVTSLGKGAGVTTIAAGLANSLSETGDGNVLVVDLTPGQGSAQQFYKGKPVVGLDDIGTLRDSAQIQDNLFVVGEGLGSDKLSRILPQRFNKLLPKLKASDFDYIIFDMPPVSQISITPRLAGFMDMVLLVVESEKTDQDIVRRATALLAESNAHVGAVLNKTITYVPERLHQDSLGNA